MPTAPVVRCKQPATPPVPAPPAKGEWVEWVPAVPGSALQGAARLSERASAWIAGLLGTVAKERSLRGLEHACLDSHEKKGLIRQ